MATTLATARGDVYTLLAAALTNCNAYKRRQTNYQYPCFVVGWPQEYDPEPTLGGSDRDFTLDVFVACEVTEDDSTDDLLSSILDVAVAALQTSSRVVHPVTDFGEQQTADDRTVIWCRLPVLVLA